MWPQHMAFICYDLIALLQIMQVRWGSPCLLLRHYLEGQEKTRHEDIGMKWLWVKVLLE